jgi:hypothetical protein
MKSIVKRSILSLTVLAFMERKANLFLFSFPQSSFPIFLSSIFLSIDEPTPQFQNAQGDLP